MKIKLFILFLNLAFLGNVLSAVPLTERRLRKAIDLSHEVPKKIYDVLSLTQSRSCSEADANPKICPAVLLDEILDNKYMGTIGIINKIMVPLTKSEDVSNPDKVCEKASLATNIQLKDINLNCKDDLSKNEISRDKLLRGQDYIKSFYLEKRSQVEANMLSLLSVKTQIDHIIGPSKSSSLKCTVISNQNAASTCQKLSLCTKVNKSLYDNKLDKVIRDIEVINALKREMAPRYNKEEFTKSINEILELNPILKSDDFLSLQDGNKQPLDRNRMSKIFNKVLNKTRDQAISNIKKNNNADQCMAGKKYNCRNFREIVRTNFTEGPVRVSGTSPYYSCIESAKENRNEANKILNQAALSAVLGFTPFVTIKFANDLYKGSKLIKTAAGLAKINSMAIKGTIAFDSAYALYEFSKIKNACKEKLKILTSSSANISANLTCEQQHTQMQLQAETDECTSQLLTAGLMSLSPGLGILSLRLLKNNAPTFSALLNNIDDTDDEFTGLIKAFSKKITNNTLRQAKLKDLETKAVSLLKSSEGYTKEEIKSGLKLLIRRCLK